MKKDRRPVTQREIKQRKKKETEFAIITNKSKQVIHIQTGGDFFLENNVIRLGRNKTVKRPVSKLLMHQLENLQKKGFISYRIVEE